MFRQLELILKDIETQRDQLVDENNELLAQNKQLASKVVELEDKAYWSIKERYNMTSIISDLVAKEEQLINDNAYVCDVNSKLVSKIDKLEHELKELKGQLRVGTQIKLEADLPPFDPMVIGNNDNEPATLCDFNDLVGYGSDTDSDSDDSSFINLFNYHHNCNIKKK